MSISRALGGGIALPLVWTAYFQAVVGPRLPEPLGQYHATPALWVFYLAPLVGLGVLAVWGSREAPFAGTFVVVGLVLLPHVPGLHLGSLFSANFPALFLLVFLYLVGAAEYGLRRPDLARRLLSRRAVGIGLVLGFVHAGLALVLRTAVFGFGWPLRGLGAVVLAGWMVGGAVLAGGIPTVAFVRFRLVTPVVVVVVAFVATAWETWRYLVDLQDSGASMAVAFTPFTGYLLAWFVVVAVALLMGILEYWARRYIDRKPAP